MENYLEPIFGYLSRRPDGSYPDPDRAWNYNRDTYETCTRFYEIGFREVIHKREDGEWIVSIGYHDQFAKGQETHKDVRSAKRWADERDDEELYYLEAVVDSLRAKHNQKEASNADNQDKSGLCGSQYQEDGGRGNPEGCF